MSSISLLKDEEAKSKLLLEGNTTYIRAQVQQNTYLLILDTGAEVSCISSKYQHLFPNKTFKELDIIQSCHGQESVNIYEISLILDEWLFFTDVAIIDGGVFDEIEVNTFPVIGVLGLDFLLKYKAFIDFKNLDIYYHR